MKEYSDGRGHEIYRIQLKEYYHQFTFIEIVKNIYNEGQVVCFAIEIEVDGATILKLNPVNCANVKLKDLIEKGKKFNFKGDSYDSGDISERKDFTNTFNLNSKGDTLSNRRETKRYKEGHKGNSVSVFAYLICADKSMADNVANKEKDSNENNSVKEESKSINKKEEIQSDENEDDNKIKEKTKFSNKSKTFINPIDKNDKSDKPMSKVFTSPAKKLITNSVVKSQEQGTKGVFKELMKSINNNLNMQMALIDKDSSSESDDDDEDENIFQFRTFALEVNIKDYHIIEDRNTLKKKCG